MDLEIKQLGQTLAVGALSLIGLYLLLRCFLKRGTPEDKKKHEIEGQVPGEHDFKFLFSAIYLSMIFSFGILMENLSKNVAARRSPQPLQFLKIVQSKIVPSDSTMRYVALMNPDNPGQGGICRPRRLVAQCNESRLFSKYV